MNIYFSGIGGVGIGPLAEIAKDAGYNVVGSDLSDSPVTKELRKKQIEISLTQDGSFLQQQHQKQPIDWFVGTSALPPNHPELLLAQKLGIKTAKRDELLAQIIKDKKLKLIAIAGTHGKTTTTSLMVWTLQQLNIPVSYSIGTTIPFGPSGKYDPKSEYFVYECDEFDRNFLAFEPFLSLITALDYDHTEIYPTQQDYFDAFVQFVTQSQKTITWQDQNSEIFNNKIPQSRLEILPTSAINQQLKLFGEKNRRNATLAQKALLKLKITQNTDEILSSFPGVDRRFERLADNLYTDYGHLPAEIAATLELAHEISDKVILVYQPHQNRRQHQLQDQYTNQFEMADAIYWLPTYLTREDPNLTILTPADLTQNITNKNAVHIAELDDKLWQTIQNYRQQGTLVLIMGAGPIDGWVRDQLEKSN